MSKKIFVNNPQVRPQGVWLTHGEEKTEEEKKIIGRLKIPRKSVFLNFLPGINEVDKKDWDKAMKNTLFAKKVTVMQYLSVVEGEPNVEEGELVLTKAIIEQTYDLELLEKWLEELELSNTMKAALRKQIKRVEAKEEAEEEAKEEEAKEEAEEENEVCEECGDEPCSCAGPSNNKTKAKTEEKIDDEIRDYS